jgi:broad-specificity NMP kinase
MGIRNYLIDGVSGSGKTSVFHELRRRSIHAVNGDRELAYQGDPKTGEPLDGFSHQHHIWNVDKVRALVADKRHSASFFCGGSRNFPAFIDLFDLVFVLDVDLDTLMQRLAERPDNEWGGKLAENHVIQRLHVTKEDLPTGGIVIDATAPIERVVDAILEKCI